MTLSSLSKKERKQMELLNFEGQSVLDSRDVTKIILDHTHALDAPKADAGKVYPLKINSKVEIQGRVGRFLKIKDLYHGKQVYVTGNRAYIVL